MTDDWSLKDVYFDGRPELSRFSEEDIEILRQKLIEDLEELNIEMRHYDSWDPEKMYKDDITNLLLNFRKKMNKRFGVDE